MPYQTSQHWAICFTLSDGFFIIVSRFVPCVDWAITRVNTAYSHQHDSCELGNSLSVNTEIAWYEQHCRSRNHAILKYFISPPAPHYSHVLQQNLHASSIFGTVLTFGLNFSSQHQPAKNRAVARAYPDCRQLMDPFKDIFLHVFFFLCFTMYIWSNVLKISNFKPVWLYGKRKGCFKSMCNYRADSINKNISKVLEWLALGA